MSTDGDSGFQRECVGARGVADSLRVGLVARTAARQSSQSRTSACILCRYDSSACRCCSCRHRIVCNCNGAHTRCGPSHTAGTTGEALQTSAAAGPGSTASHQGLECGATLAAGWMQTGRELPRSRRPWAGSCSGCRWPPWGSPACEASLGWTRRWGGGCCGTAGARRACPSAGCPTGGVAVRARLPRLPPAVPPLRSLARCPGSTSAGASDCRGSLRR